MIKLKVITPPNRIKVDNNHDRLFLAGSIEMGKAERWQDAVIQKIKDYKDPRYVDLTIFNPRRHDWDNSWEQTYENPFFSQQVNWELNSLDHSNHILFYFSPGTVSPVTMLELGLHIRAKNLIVVCPEGFHRKGNVDIVCERYGIKQVETLDEAVKLIIDNCSHY